MRIPARDSMFLRSDPRLPSLGGRLWCGGFGFFLFLGRGWGGCSFFVVFFFGVVACMVFAGTPFFTVPFTLQGRASRPSRFLPLPFNSHGVLPHD